MTTLRGQQDPFEDLEYRLQLILPEEYQDADDEVQPVSMGSAALQFDRDGQVAWDLMWGSFCDLAMAGGPPHKGKLLEPAAPAVIAQQTDQYATVVWEICRGIGLAADLSASPSTTLGWIRVFCSDETMAGWLLRAIVMENVAVKMLGTTIDLPASPLFRLEKEIKNVITVVAKTCHYWSGHIPDLQQRAIAQLFRKMATESPLIEPARSADGVRTAAEQALCDRIGDAIRRALGLQASSHTYSGWVGLECPHVRGAIWLMRTLVALNVLARREETTLFVAVNPTTDPSGAAAVQAVLRAHEFSVRSGVLTCG
jgi:sirohydrochlorin cobaltochelatase